MIEPTVGRVVLYRPIDEEGHSEEVRHAATVACVNPTGSVNLSVADSYGQSYHIIGAKLVQDDEVPEPGQCEWMAYQKGQAAKTEALENTLGDASTLNQDNVIDFEKGADYDADPEINIDLGAEGGDQSVSADVTVGDDGKIEDVNVLGDALLMGLREGMSFLEVDGREYNVSSIAELCHEANRLHCQSVGDDSQQAWEDAPEWQKQSAISGVYNVLVNPEITPEESHLSWLMVKSAEGWKYGEVKNEVEKIHPCMVDYADLSDDHKVKDLIFINTVRSAMGLEELEAVVNS